MSSRNLALSSSAFSANQSPFFSSISPTCQLSESMRSGILGGNTNISVDLLSSSSGNPDPEASARFNMPDGSPTIATSISRDFQNFDCASTSAGLSSRTQHASTSTGLSNRTQHSSGHSNDDCYTWHGEKQRKHGRRHGTTFNQAAVSFFSHRRRICDVFIGLNGRKPSLLRFANWLRAELESQGMSCFMSDRAQCRNSRKHGIVEREMDDSSFGVIILTRKSFRNPYTIEELRFFSGKKNLVPIFFDLSPGDCLVRDIIEKRGELWEKNGGELWLMYGGLEKEWREAINILSRVDEWWLEAADGNWRDCIGRVVSLLAARLGRRSVVERLNKWREKVEKEEFPFPRNENFIGRKKELSELEFILFGDFSGDSERDYIELKARPRRKNLTIGRSKSSVLDERCAEHQLESDSRKGKESVVWKESEKEIRMQGTELSKRNLKSRSKSGRRFARRKRSVKIVYRKGVACVSGDSGMGKTELLLEFAYRHHKKYKMVLWVGGESRYIRRNYLNLWSYLEVDVGIDFSEKSKIKNFEEHEDAAVSRVRRELMREIPFLVVIDNLESEKDWWDHKLVMDLLPRFGGETHILISTHLARVMNLEPLKLSYLSGVESMLLMQGSMTNYSITEIDALRVLEEKVGRLTLGLAIIGSILSELRIMPSRLLDTINRIPLQELSWSGGEAHSLRRHTFLLQLFEACFSIFDRDDAPRSLATRMVQVSAWFAPAAIPVSLLVLAAQKIPEEDQGTRIWRKVLHSVTCGLMSPYTKRSEAEASSMLVRFNIARSSTKSDYIHFNELIKQYVRKRGVTGVAQAMVQTVLYRGSVSQHPEHAWASCFLLYGFGDPIVVEVKVSELLYIVKVLVLPLAIRTFITFSRCNASLELLRLCTTALEAADQAFVNPVEKWLDKSIFWRPVQTKAQLNPYLWQELALSRATVLETRAKLMIRGGEFDIGDDLIRKAIFIRTSISGENHPDTVAARETLSKLTRLLANIQFHTSP